MTRLSPRTLPGARAALPSYDRARVTPGIVHLGLGKFHRAHQAAYVDDGLAEDPSWGILGVSLRRPDMAVALGPQRGLYTLAVRDGTGTRPRVVGSVPEAMHAGPDTAHLVALMSDPAILVAALAARRAAGIAPFTVLSCDNLPSNGATTRRVVAAMAALRDDALAAWIEGEGAFPSTVVDRIVPATTEEDRAEVARLTGREDAWPVATEPFTQWVVEDAFAAGSPPLPGAERVADVEPVERMKLRMLNGAHSTLAYLGQLVGAETVAEAVADPDLLALLRGLWTEEVAPTLDVPADLAAYARALLTRFANPALRHRTAQIAMDGSQKIPQRLLGTIADRRRAGRPHRRATLGVAAWIEHATAGRVRPDDPMADRFPRGGPPEARAVAMLDLDGVFGPLGRDPAFREEVAAAVRALAPDPRAAIRGAT